MKLIIILFFFMLVVITIADMKRQQIPNQCCVVILLLAVWAAFVFPQITIPQRLLGCVCVSVPMLLMKAIRPGAFGGGDVKLMFACGGLLGWKVTLISSCVGILLSGVYCGYLFVKEGRGDVKFPLGPFLCLGMVIGVLFGEKIMNWYMG
ncbi:MAG: A24 family peptidase [Hespellia sp.]|nr:A24 family peptidase [Hespellia sp.]